MTAPFFLEGNVSLISEDYHSIKEREGDKGFIMLIIKLKTNMMLNITLN